MKEKVTPMQLIEHGYLYLMTLKGLDYYKTICNTNYVIEYDPIKGEIVGLIPQPSKEEKNEGKNT